MLVLVLLGALHPEPIPRVAVLDLDLSNNWQTSHQECHANEKEEMLLAMFRLQAGLECLSRHAFNCLIL